MTDPSISLPSMTRRFSAPDLLTPRSTNDRNKISPPPKRHNPLSLSSGRLSSPLEILASYQQWNVAPTTARAWQGFAISKLKQIVRLGFEHHPPLSRKEDKAFIERTIEEFIAQGVNTTSILERLREGCFILFNGQGKFLKQFFKIYQPSTFLEEFANLSNEEKQVLLHIIGGESVFNILKHFSDTGYISLWKKRVEFELALLRRLTAFKQEIGFTEFFDLSQLLTEEICKSFRSYFISTKTPCPITLNNRLLTLSQMPKKFFTSYIVFLESALKLKSVLSPKTQAKMIINHSPYITLGCIPTLPILLAHSFPAYNGAEYGMRKLFAPLFHQFTLNKPRLCYSPFETTRFTVSVNTNGVYTVIHHKTYSIIIRSPKKGSLVPEEVEYAKLNVSWRLRGRLPGMVCSSKLSLGGLRFVQGISRSKQKQVTEEIQNLLETKN